MFSSTDEVRYYSVTTYYDSNDTCPGDVQEGGREGCECPSFILFDIARPVPLISNAVYRRARIRHKWDFMERLYA